MSALPLDALAVNKMASGHLCLNLSERIGWDAFPNFAHEFLETFLEGDVIEKTDGPDMRLWKVQIRGCSLRLVFDDFPLMVSLESSDREGDAMIDDVYLRLLNRAPDTILG
jgi:hypothetical protein